MEVGVSVLDSDEDCLNIMAEVQVIHPAALDQRVHEGCMSGSIMTSALQPVLPALGDAAEATLHGVIQKFG